MVSNLKLNNADEFYEAGLTGHLDAKFQKKIDKRKDTLINQLNPTIDRKNELLNNHQDYITQNESKVNKKKSKLFSEKTVQNPTPPI